MFLPRKSAKGSSSSAAQSEKAAAAAAARPWVEKYRPRSIDDVAAQEHTVAVLRKTLLSTNLPHMLFYGPPGTGKTSTILALARQLFGPELMRSRVLELNASDERGISVVRDKIKSFAKMAVSHADVDFPCPPYKIIVLDEADSMTQDAQSALRRIMEQYSRITRFCLVCNYVTRIIEPLASRCSKFRFRMLDVGSTQARLEHIAHEEGVQFQDGVMDTLVHTSDGDLRRAITYLQSAARLHSSSAVAKPADSANADAGAGADTAAPPRAHTHTHTQRTPITPASIVEIAGVVPHSVVVRLAAAAGIEPPPGEKGGDGDAMDIDGGDATASSSPASFDACHAATKSVTRAGYSASQLLLQLHDYIVSHATLPALVKARCALALGEADKALVDGADEELQLMSLVLKVLRGVQVQGK